MSTDRVYVDEDLPGLDDRLVVPEERYEMLEGVRVYVPPALEPHGMRHSKVSALLEAHAGAEFQAASDMLTRTSRSSDIAPDVSVYPRARHPETGGRQLEQLAFEVVSTESLSHAGRKAAQLVGRGVRRVFAIDVERGRALEWSRALESWSPLEPSAVIEDAALAAPLPIDALVHAANVDDAVARALLIKRNPVIEAARAQDRAEAKAEARIEAVLALLVARGVALRNEDRARIAAERDLARLDRWIVQAATCTEVAALFADPSDRDG